MNDMIEHNSGQPLDITQETTQALKRRLAHQMELSARHLVEMASIWTELERRGEDLSALRTGLTDYLPKIAAGELDAQAAVMFAGNRQLLRYLCTLPVSQQQRLIEQGSVEIYLPESQQVTPRKLSQLSGREVTQVFGHGLVRSVSEQKQLAQSKASVRKARKPKNSTPAARIHCGTLEIDGERVYAAGQPLKAEQLLDMLSQYYNADLTRAIRQKAD